MLVNFYIDPDAIDNNTNGYHVGALKTKWQSFGVLSHPSHDDGGFRNIRRKFPELNPSIQRIWARVWREIENDPTRYLKRRGDFSVALVSETHATDRQIANGESAYFNSESLGNVELIRLTEVSESQEFHAMSIRAQSGLTEGQTILDVWEERLESLASHSRHVVIVDRYSCSRIIENRLADRDNQGNGLIQLIGLMADNASLESIAVFSSLNYTPEENTHRISNPERIEIIRDALDNAMQQLGSMRLEVSFPRNDVLQNYAHDRHISFDGFRACAIGIGAEEAFQGDVLRRNTQFSYKYGEQMIDLIEAETVLRDATGSDFRFTIQC